MTHPPSTLRSRGAYIVSGAVVLGATIATVGLLTPGYRPWTDAISRLGARDEPFRVLWRSGFAVFGLLVVAGAPEFERRLRAHGRALVHLLTGFGACTVVVGIAPKDPPGTVHTMVSRIHVDSAILAGTLILAAMALAARHASSRRDRVVSAAIATSAFVGVAVFPFTWGTAGYGVIELALVAAAVGWLLALSRRAGQTTSVSSWAARPNTNASPRNV